MNDKHEARITRMQQLLQQRNKRPYTRAEAREILRGLATIIATLAEIERAGQPNK